MNFDPEAKHYVVESATGKFTTPFGLSDDKELASEFKLSGLRPVPFSRSKSKH